MYSYVYLFSFINFRSNYKKKYQNTQIPINQPPVIFHFTSYKQPVWDRTLHFHIHRKAAPRPHTVPPTWIPNKPIHHRNRRNRPVSVWQGNMYYPHWSDDIEMVPASLLCTLRQLCSHSCRRYKKRSGFFHRVASPYTCLGSLGASGIGCVRNRRLWDGPVLCRRTCRFS